ncbi:MAG: TetR/AcrR family transcriptional regulator [Bacillota bacterium]|nr:TetR/AcrR family transcriptional regulator [Bacillota bacterium]
MSKVDNNKKKKELAIYKAAFTLFTDCGIESTSISKITKTAGVAKGTFYLYFKSKYDLLDKLIIKKSNKIIFNAYENTLKNSYDNYEDRVISFINDIINLLIDQPILLKILHKKLSWGLFNEAIENKELSQIINKLIDDLYGNTVKDKLSKDDFYYTLFMILELTSSVCYNAIIKEKPTTIENMKPLLFNMIRKVLN